MKLSLLANEIGFEFSGEDLEISFINTIEFATKSQISFVESDRYKEKLINSKAGAVFIKEKLKEFLPKETIAIVVENPRVMMAKTTKYFEHIDFLQKQEPTVEQSAFIGKNAFIGNGSKVGKNVKIYPNVFIGENVVIEENTIIYANVSIYSKTKIGKNCIIHSGSVLGSDGFGFVTDEKNDFLKIYHLGDVIIEDLVEIGANVTIDRGVFGSTVVKKSTKIDNLVHLAHNVIVDEHCLMAGQSGIAGSVKLGKYVTLGGQSGIVGHIEIGDFTTIAARGVATKSLKGNNIYSGFPARIHKDWLKLQAKLSQLIKG